MGQPVDRFDGEAEIEKRAWNLKNGQEEEGDWNRHQDELKTKLTQPEKGAKDPKKENASLAEKTGQTRGKGEKK